METDVTTVCDVICFKKAENITALYIYRAWGNNACGYFKKPQGKKNEYSNCKSFYLPEKVCLNP